MYTLGHEYRTKGKVIAATGIPAAALLTEAGLPILTEAGAYILVE